MRNTSRSDRKKLNKGNIYLGRQGRNLLLNFRNLFLRKTQKSQKGYIKNISKKFCSRFRKNVSKSYILF